MEFAQLPKTWVPGRPQSAHDRDFKSNAEILREFSQHSARSQAWTRAALEFSSIIFGGIPLEETLLMQQRAEDEIRRTARKNGK